MAKASPQQRVLATAASQIGYSRWSDSNRGTKYARETQPVFWPRDTWLLANGISYCDLFITWVFWKALGKDFVTSGALPAGASYNTDYRASKGGRISKSSARPGDVLVFDWNWATASTNHVGILEKRLSSGNFQTIEGNTSTGSSGSQSNGGRVARRTRRQNQVRYVIRPNWSKAGGSSSSGGSSAAQPWETSKTISTMPKGTVKGVQRLLQGLGYSLGSYGVDGSYGESTYNAVRKAQKDLGVAVDGVAGPTTIAALKKASASTPSKPAPSKPSSGKLKVDGRMGTSTVTELQEFLNEGSPRRGGKKITVDGRAGADTWVALATYLDAPYKDGIVSRQSHTAKSLGNGIVAGKSWEVTGPNSEGSQLVELLQKWVGVTADGIWGEKTSEALQVKLNQH